MSISQENFEKLSDSVAELDARKDEHLKDYLVQTRTYKKILADPRKVDLLVGLKGSGKSSLYNTLTQPFPKEESSSRKIIRIGISPLNSTWDLEASKVNILQFSESAKSGLAIYILRHLDENIDSYAEKIAIKNQISKPFSALASLVKSFQGISILGCGVSFKALDKTKGKALEPLPKSQTDPAIEILKKFTDRGFRIEVVTDDADRIFGGHELDKHLLGGFILGSNDLKKQVPGLSVVHIVKSHVKEALFSVEEFTNLSTRAVQYIAWSTDELLELITKRLEFANLAWKDIFGFTEKQYKEYFEFKLRNGPRDLLRHLDIVLQNANGVRKLSLDDFERNEQDYRSYAFQQMQVVFGDVFKDIGEFVRELFKKKA